MQKCNYDVDKDLELIIFFDTYLGLFVLLGGVFTFCIFSIYKVKYGQGSRPWNNTEILVTTVEKVDRLF